MMKIYTKTGDDGTTSLSDGKRLLKCDALLDSYGTVDELNAFVGLLISEENEEFLTKVQRQLFVLGGMLATPVELWDKYWNTVRLEDYVLDLEREIDRLSAQLPPWQGFVLPQGNRAIGYAHVCRTVCRRAERQVVALQDRNERYKQVQKVLNRLSDYFFSFAMFLHQKDEIPVIYYKSDR